MSNEPKTYPPFTAEDAGRIRINFPPTLLVLNHWVAWNESKSPINPKTGKNARSNDPKTWGNFETASRFAMQKKLPGIGFMFGGTSIDLIGIDFDKCLHKDGTAKNVGTVELVRRIGSYCEKSPSGLGLHSLCIGTVPKDFKLPGMEIYHNGARYFTVTGRVFEGMSELREANESFREYYVKTTSSVVSGSQARSQPLNRTESNKSVAELDDQELLQKMFDSQDGQRLADLYAGNWLSHYLSQSEADLALAGTLGWWTDYDQTRTDSLFRQSGLMRNKWDESHSTTGETYGTITIGKAFNGKGPGDGYRVSREMISTAGKSNNRVAPQKVTTKALAEFVLDRHSFAKDAGDKLYVYTGGTYKPNGEEIVQKTIKEALRQWRKLDEWNTNRNKQTVAYIVGEVPRLLDRPSVSTINLLNGLFDLQTMELKPHSSNFLSLIQLPVSYDPNATCPFWEEFIEKTFPSDTQELAWEIPALLMTPYTSLQKAIMLVGEGANGKSRYLAGIREFIGRHNTSSVSLQKLHDDRFAASRLFGKLANICPDLPSRHLSETSIFKQIVEGNEPIDGERKFGHSFEFVPYSRLVFSANNPPRSSDSSLGFFRRWLIIPFDRVFSPSDKDFVRSDILDKRLSSPEELSGLLLKAITRGRSIKLKGLSQSKSTEEAFRGFRETTDPFSVWMDIHTIAGPEMSVDKGALRTSINRYAGETGKFTLSANGFGRALNTYCKEKRINLYEKQKTISGKVVWCYVGIGLSAN